MFGKKYDPATGKITGANIGATGADDIPLWITTAPVWIPILKEVVGILRDAFKPGNTMPDPTDNTNNNNNNQQGSTSSMLLPIILVGGAAAAYFIFAGKKK
jgi:hypothetical protein